MSSETIGIDRRHMIRPIITAVVILALSSAPPWVALAAAVEWEARTLDGQTARGAISRWEHERLELATTAGAVTIPTDRLLSMRPVMVPALESASPAPGEARLTDGSAIRITDFVSDGKEARCIGSAEFSISLPAKSVHVVRWGELKSDLTSQWEAIVAAGHAGDTIVIRKGESLDFVEGIIQSVETDKVLFKLDSDTVPVRREKVYGLVYHRLPTAEDAAARVNPCVVFTKDGSRFAAESTHLDADNLVVRSRAGFRFELPIARIERLDFSDGKVAYLSDLPFESVEWTPYIGNPASAELLQQAGLPRRDRAFDIGPLRLGEREYAKGLSLRSRTTVVYRLSGQYRRFSAVAGMDDRVGNKGHVEVEISGDGRSLLKSAFQGADSPRPLDLDVSGVKRLRIVVDYGEDLDVSDLFDLCDAKVLK